MYLQPHPPACSPAELVDGGVERRPSVALDQERGVERDPLVPGSPTSMASAERHERGEHRVGVVLALALDRGGDQLAEPDPLVVGGVLRRAAQRLAQPRDVLVLLARPRASATASS